MKFIATTITLCLIFFSSFIYAKPEKIQWSTPMTDTYSQQELLKNWTLCVCLTYIVKDVRDINDINESASGYFEFGNQPLSAYDQLRKLAKKYANKKYGGSIKSDFNTMKCIDLYHSKELDELTKKLVENTTSEENQA